MSEKRKPRPEDYPPPFSYGWLAPRYWGVWLGMGLLRLLTALPGGFRRALGRRLGAIAYARNKKRRAIVATNLAWCFPELPEAERERMARDYFALMAQTFLDYGLLWWAPPERLDALVTLEGTEHLDELLAAGRRVILMTGHTVALDFGAAALTRRYLLAGMFKRLRNPVLDWAVAHGRRRFKGILVPREAGVRPLIRALREGHVVYHLPDEDLGPRHSVFAPFFGIETATVAGMGRMARVADAVMVPYATIYLPQEGRYVARFFPPIDGFPSDDEGRDAAAMNAELERMIRLAPEQYMWSMRIFQTRPDGAPPPYAMKGRTA